MLEAFEMVIFVALHEGIVVPAYHMYNIQSRLPFHVNVSTK